MEDSEVKIVEQRLKSFTPQLHTECGILERLVYKHKNQHRRCSYFQYILKVRRDLQLLKSANLEEVSKSCFLVINNDRPKQNVQLLEGLKRRKTGGGKYNFLDRLLGVTRLLSQIVEPLLKAAIDIHASCKVVFHEVFPGDIGCACSYTSTGSTSKQQLLPITHAEIATMLLDSVLLYNTISSLSQKEQSIKLKQDGFEVFREYFPKKEEARLFLECIWEKDKFVLVERTHKSETASQDNDVRGDLLRSTPQIIYENMEVILGDKSVATTSAQPAADTINVKEDCMKEDEKNVAEASTANTVSSKDASINPATVIFSQNKLSGDESCFVRISEANGTHTQPADSTLSYPVKREKGKKVAIVAVKPSAPSTTDRSKLHSTGTKRNGKDPFFDLLTSGNKSSLL